MYASIGNLSINVRRLIAAGALAAGYLLFQYAKGYYPWNIQIALVGLFFYHLGVEIKQSGIYEKNLHWLVGVLAVGASMALVILSNQQNSTWVNLAGMQAGELLPFLGSTIFGSAGAFILGKLLAQSKFLLVAGTHTIILFGYNYWVLRLGNYIAMDKHGWVASFTVQIPFYVVLVWISRKTGFLAPGNAKKRRDSLEAGPTIAIK